MITVRRVVLSTALIALGAASLSALPAPAKAQASLQPAPGCLTNDVGATGQQDPFYCITNGLTPASASAPAQTAANAPAPPTSAPPN